MFGGPGQIQHLWVRTTMLLSPSILWVHLVCEGRNHDTSLQNNFVQVVLENIQLKMLMHSAWSENMVCDWTENDW